MKVGDLVKYRGWSKNSQLPEPLALVIEQVHADSSFHHRIRVMWLGEDVPLQAQVLSVTPPKRVSTWINPKHFEVVNPDPIDDDPEYIWRVWGDQ